MKKPIKILLLLVAVAMLTIVNAYFYITEKAKQLPDVEFTLLNGKLQRLDELKGSTILLNFWATTCVPCRKEISDLVDLYQEFSAKGVQLIGIAMSHDRPDHVIAFQQRYKIPYPIAIDVDSAVANNFNVDVIPVTLLISPRGQIEYRHRGIINIDDMRKRITAMLPGERR